MEGGTGTDTISVDGFGLQEVNAAKINSFALTDTQIGTQDDDRLNYTGLENFDFTFQNFHSGPFTVAYFGDGSQTGVWTPSGVATNQGQFEITSGSVVKTVRYDGNARFYSLSSLTVQTPAGADLLTLGSAAENIFDPFDPSNPDPFTFGTLSGTVNGMGQLGKFTDIDALIIDLGAGDSITPVADQLTVASLQTPGVQNLTVRTGAGDDRLELLGGVTTLALPVSGGVFSFDAGTGKDTLKATRSTAMALTFTSASAGTLIYASGMGQLSFTGFGDSTNASAAESFDLNGNSLALHGTGNDDVTYQPTAALIDSKADLLNGAVAKSVTFDGQLAFVRNHQSLTLKTPAGADSYEIGVNVTPELGTIAQLPISGTSISTIFELVSSVTLDLGANDLTPQSDLVTVNSLAVDALQSFAVKTGDGDDTITFGATLTTLDLPQAGGIFSIDAGAGTGDKVIITRDTDLTLTNTASVFKIIYGDDSELTHTGLENFDLTVDTLAFSGSDAETLLWTPRGTASDDHEGTITVDNIGLATKTITYDLDLPALPTDFPLAFSHVFQLTLETAAGGDTYTLAATPATGVLSLSGSAAGVAHSATLSTIDTLALDFGKNDATVALDKLTVSSLELEGANSINVSTGGGADELELTSDLTRTKIGLLASTPTGAFTFNAGGNPGDTITATRLATTGSIELTNTTLAYGSTTPINYTGVLTFDLAADQVNYTGSGTETVALGLSGTTANDGLATLGGSRTLLYSGKVGILSVTNLTIMTPAGVDSLTLGGATIGSLTGTVAGSISQAVDFSNVANITLDLAANDGAAATNDSLKISSLAASALANFNVITGGGDDTLELLPGLTTLVLPGNAANHVKWDAGAGTDKIKAEANVSMQLGITGGTQDGLAYQDNTTNHAALGFLEFTGNAVELAELTGGAADNRFVVTAWAHPATISGLGGADLFDVSGGLTGGTATTPSQLLGGDGDDTFIVQTTVDAAINGLTGTATIDGGNDSDTIVASGNVNFVLKETDLTRSVVAFKTTPASTLTINTSALEKAELTGGVRANLIDAGQFTGTSKLIGKGGVDNLVAGKTGGELYGFDTTLPTAAQLKVKAFALTYTRDNYFVSDGTVSGATTSILAAKKTSNVISFRYFQSNDAALGIQYTLQLNNSSNTQQVSRVAGQDLNVTVGINGVASGQIDILEGSSYNDRLTGSKRTNILAGLRGNDHLIAVGVDFRYGGPGADTFAGPPSFAFQDRTFAIPGADGASKTKVRSAYTPVSTPFPRPGPVEITEESIFPSTDELIDRIAAITG